MYEKWLQLLKMIGHASSSMCIVQPINGVYGRIQILWKGVAKSEGWVLSELAHVRQKLMKA